MNIPPSYLFSDSKNHRFLGSTPQLFHDLRCICNQVILFGCVEGYDKIKCLKSRNGRMICFSLKTCDQIGIQKQTHTEFHRVVINDKVVANSALECKSLIIPGRWLLVCGVLRHRYLVDRFLRSAEITEIHALSISPADPAWDQKGVDGGEIFHA